MGDAESVKIKRRRDIMNFYTVLFAHYWSENVW